MTSYLDRFVEAQDGIFEEAIDEIIAGKKRTHWMWFVFPQLRGLGQSDNSMYYGLRNREDAMSYLAHPVLGPRIQQATRCVLDANTPTKKIFGEVDYKKFVSCMTLFSFASPPGSIFCFALSTLSTSDERTAQILGEANDTF